MLRSCPACGRIHDSRVKCRSKQHAPRESRASKYRSTADWQRTRDEVRDLDMNMCVVCRSLGIIATDGLSVHHIVPLEEEFGLRNDFGNCVTLCSAHHEEAERGDISRSALRDLIGRYRKGDSNPPGLTRSCGLSAVHQRRPDKRTNCF